MTTPVEINWSERPCVLEDREFVNGLVRETLFPLVREFHVPDETELEERFARKYAQHSIILDGSQPIGFYLIETQEDILHVRRLFLSAGYRGCGIGGRLMRRFEALGLKTLRLEVWENNPACAFYMHHGYQVIATKGHKLVMEKTL
jgi:ribosomal protein S18 acetylase RimI-like enzyme